MTSITSVAMSAELNEELCGALLRSDGQEDIRLILYARSTGATRRTALLREVVNPDPGDRAVHGNASITSGYILRACSLAAEQGWGLAIAHSHPGGQGWQSMSAPDYDAESAFGNLVREITGLPFVGLTLAGSDTSWSARHWDQGCGRDLHPSHSSHVRVVGRTLEVSWPPQTNKAPPLLERQVRSVLAWGPTLHSDLIRRRVLVVGLGSVGLDIAVRLAATGFTDLGFMDFDTIAPVNLDRLIGATRKDAETGTRKIDLAKRLASEQSTAENISIQTYDYSICESDGQQVALDYDLIFSCVDRPWARAVLNALAYSDLIPVIDGGIAIDAFADGGIRNAVWRSHVIGPGHPCMSCNGQLDLGQVQLDIDRLLDDPEYIRTTNVASPVGAPNVAMLSVSVAASQLAQFVSLNTAPGGLGDPGPLRYLLSTHTLEHIDAISMPHCPIEAATAVGDQRLDMTGHHVDAEEQRARWALSQRSWRPRLFDLLRSRRSSHLPTGKT